MHFSGALMHSLMNWANAASVSAMTSTSLWIC